MPIVSKYSNEQVEKIVDEVITVLQTHKAPVDLSLMTLGNAITHIIKEHVPAAKQAEVANNFSQALKQSVK